jgi:predicted metal-dependent peptidase
VKVTDPEVLIKQAIFQMLFSYRFLGGLSLGLKRVIDNTIDTMATDSRSLFYNVKFVFSLPFDELVFILGHEVLHAALGHCNPFRIGKRTLWVMGKDGSMMLLWNIAVDFVVNGMGQQAIDDWTKQNGTGKKPFMRRPSWVFYDKAYQGMSAEAIYDDLVKKMKTWQMVPSSGGAKGQGAPGPGTMVAQVPFEGRHPDTHLSHERLKSSMDDAQARNLADQWKHRINKEIMSMKQAGKHIPDFIKQISDIVMEPEKVDWRTELRSYLVDMHKSIHRYNPPNKRYFHLNLIMPSIRGEHLEVVIASDTSGSMLQQLKEIYGELMHVFSAYDSYRVTLVETDTDIRAVKEYENGMDFSDDMPEGKGGGGTDFRKVFEWIEENRPGIKLVIFPTDGHATFPAEDPGIPTLWIVPEGPGNKKPGDFPFGDVIVLNDPVEAFA